MYRKVITLLSVSLMMLSTLAAGGITEDKEMSITIFAAASTTDLVGDIAALYTAATGTIVKVNPASSGILARQIEQGAAPDIYLSASKRWMDYVDNLGLITRSAPFLKNRLVIISAADSDLKAFEITESSVLREVFRGRISMGDPSHVPAGRYAEEVLRFYGIFDAVEDRIIPAVDVRSALLVVELDEADVGIVYETDAMKSGKVKMLSFFPETSHTSILYFCALLESASAEGEAFYDFMFSDSNAAGLILKYGFTIPE